MMITCQIIQIGLIGLVEKEWLDTLATINPDEVSHHHHHHHHDDHHDHDHDCHYHYIIIIIAIRWTTQIMWMLQVCWQLS